MAMILVSASSPLVDHHHLSLIQLSSRMRSSKQRFSRKKTMTIFSRKTPKSQQADKTPFTVYEIHSRPISDRASLWTQGYYQVLSIDPAWKNFAVRIERRYPDGRVDPPLLYTRFDFTQADKNKPDNIDDCVLLAYGVMLANLEPLVPLFLDCHIAMIERQLPENYQSTRCMQHALSFLMTRLRDGPLMPLIMDVDPQLKGRMLGAPKGCKGNDLKKWAEEKALEILLARGDHTSLEILTKHGKKDDLSDTVVQIEAWFAYNGLPTTKLPEKAAPGYTPLVPPIPTAPVGPVTGAVTGPGTGTVLGRPGGVVLRLQTQPVMHLGPPNPIQALSTPMAPTGSTNLSPEVRPSTLKLRITPATK